MKGIIVINSSNRIDKLKTHKIFDEDLNWVMAIPKDQEELYSALPELKDHLYLIPDDVPQYLPSQRQHIMEHFGKKYPYVFLMDDDLVFLKRKHGIKLKKCKSKDVVKMVKDVEKHLKEFPIVGISTRFGNNCVKEDYTDITRVTRCYAIDTKIFFKVGAVFNPFEPFVAEDFHLNICFLNKGYPNRVLYKYAQDDAGSNQDGGCSLYRTPEVQKKTSMWMAAHHPEVTVKVKKSKNWKGFGDTRVDMVIAWKKAYKRQRRQKSSWLKRSK